jgi:hypothetical protein
MLPYSKIMRPYDRGALIKEKFILEVAELYWPLLTGGRCSEVVIKAGLTVTILIIFIQFLKLHKYFL